MNSDEEDKKVEAKSVSCSLTFQNAIEIDYAKLREMAKTEAATSTSGDVPTKLTEEDSLTASVLQSSSTNDRDLSVYDRPADNQGGADSSDDEEERSQEEEPETEVENSEEEEEDHISMQYEQLGSTEFTKANSDDDDDNDGGGHSDGEFGEFESCPVSYQSMSEDNDSGNSSSDNRVDKSSTNTDMINEGMSRHEVGVHRDIGGDCSDDTVVEDRTQDVLGSQHPRTPARVIPPLDEDKIALIKSTMAGLSLKPPGGGAAARVADAVIKAKPRVGDELK